MDRKNTKARIAIAGFQHETNCFMPTRTDYDGFADIGDRPKLNRGDDTLEIMPGKNAAISGFLDTIDSAHEMAPLLWTSGGAGGYVTRDAFERITGELVGRLSQAMPVDAVYLDLHGAMCSEDYEDSEGEVLRRVRAAIGPDVPLVISLDYHVNLTPQMAELTDGMAIYLTYPHIDRPETGARAARILETILEHGRPTARAFRDLPFLIPLNFQCTMVEPSKGIVERSVEGEGGDVLDLCYGAGFPPSDLYHCGPSVIAHGYDQAAVDEAADGLTDYIASLEEEFAQPMLTPDEGVQRAMKVAASASKPVVIADTQDNPGCGGSADTTGVLEALVRNDAQDAVLGLMTDSEAADAAHAAGEGATITIELGGRTPIPGVKPYAGTFEVVRLSDGAFTCTGPCVGGRVAAVGKTALLRIGGVSVIVASKRMQAHDQEIFRHIGIEPSEQKIVVVKSTCHFRADFEPIAEEVIVVIAPGGHIVDAREYPYQYLRAGVRLEPLGPAFEPA